MREIKAIVPLAPPKPTKKRVAAYARVSVLKEESLRSLSAQVSHYSKLIQSRLEWEYAGVYADEAQPGTNDNRPEFQRLMADCRAGKIDIVLVKSISRLARNTVTMLETVRELKSLNVDVWFENESIRSLSTEGELMLSILASFAQEEAFSTSENTKWKLRKRFAEGRQRRITMLGYKVVDERFVIIPEEAVIVRFIFDEFIKGAKKRELRDKLAEVGYRPKMGGAMFNLGTLDQMLKNETYTGVLILQRYFTVDHISKKVRKNRGEVPMYRVENNHEPIISREVFDKAQAMLAYQAKHKGLCQTHPSAGKIYCGLCGKTYLRAVGRKGTSSETIHWMCNTYAQKGKKVCAAQMVPQYALLNLGLEFEKIIILPQETFIVTLRDSSEFTTQWQRRTRKEAFAARKRQLEMERNEAQCQQPKEL